jgi:lipoprotein-releasing system permease protein
MPLLAALAVTLCTAMVLIVWSVMGGFLNSLLASGRGMIGDVSVAWPVYGIPHYQELIDELEADDLVDAATPTIESLGLLGLDNGEQRFVTVIGVEPADYDRVTDFYGRLWWRPLEEPLAKDRDREDVRLEPEFRERFEQTLGEGRRLEEIDPDTGLAVPAMALGIQVTRYNQRRPEGFYEPGFGVFVPNERYTLGLLPMSRRAVVVGAEYRELPVANEFRSGMYEVDANWVILPLATLQEMTKLDGAERVDPSWRPGALVRNEETGRLEPERPRVIGRDPARATHILVRAADGVEASRAEERVEAVYEAFAARHSGEVPLPPSWRENVVYEWEEKPQLRTFIAAVRKETALVLTLFAFISVTAAFLVCAIFWSMVSEKTKDIGILRAIGASRGGVAWLFLRYGMAIGVIGSAAGGALAWVIVSNINPIHEWMGTALGLYIWDPSVYYFTEIPSDVEPAKAAFVLAGGVVFSVLGALLPALRAAWMDPVRALRFE